MLHSEIYVGNETSRTVILNGKVNSMKTLLYVRHGETDLNVAGIFAGRLEAVLTEKGKLQAKQVGEALLENRNKIDLIICSPSSRTIESAILIASRIGFDRKNILKNDIFLERSFGILEGTATKEFFATNEYKDLDHVEGCECIENLDKRAQKAFKWLKSLNEKNILIVGHSAFARALRRSILGLPYTNEYETTVLIENAAILKLV